jgi:hypothetical protein
MSPITHFLASWTLGDATGCKRRDCALVTWCGALPDVDGLGIVVDAASGVLGRPDTWYYGIYHHSLLHGLPAAILIPGVLSLFAIERLRVFVIGVVAVHLHLMCDLLGSRGPAEDDIWPINYLSPFSDALSVSWQGQWELNAWPNIFATIVLLMWIFARSVRTGHSPVGVFSSRADQLFVEAVRNRWSRLRGEAKS